MGGRRATSSRVPADRNVGEVEGGWLTDTRSARKADGSGVTMFRKTNRTSRAQRRQCNTIEQCHRWQLLYRSTKTKDRALTGEGLPTVEGCLSEPGEEGVKANSTNP